MSSNNSPRLTEVFSPSRLREGKYYSSAFHRYQQGEYPNIKYFTEGPLTFVGKYTHTKMYGGGWGDGRQEHYHFVSDDGKEIVVPCDYNGLLCFIEVSPPKA